MGRLISTGAILAALALGIAGPAAAATGAAAATAHQVTIKVVGIDRSGDQVPVYITVTTMSGAGIATGAATARLAPGTYLVSADVQDQAPSLAQSLVVRKVRVTRSETITLVGRPDPASGFVSLRSTVTDTQGDSTTETIYGAYAIS